MHQRKNRLWAPAVIVPVLLISGCDKPKAESDARLAPRPVQVARVGPAATAEHGFTGIVMARVQSDLGFRVAGKVTQRLVDAGERVRAGQILMRIDPTDYTHATSAQLAAVEAARARARQTEAEERRNRALVASGWVSASKYDQAKADADSARALLSAAEAQERVSRDQGNYSDLLAEADGMVMETLAEPGQVVSAGQTVVRLAQAGPREAAIDLPETMRPAIGSAAQAMLFGTSDRVPAHLRQLSDAADPKTRTYQARYVLDGAGAQAPIGATVTLTLLSAAPSSLAVPVGALVDQGQGAGVWLLDRKASTVAFHPVRVVDIGAETARVTGLAEGETVVAAGGSDLHAGEAVRAVGEKVAMQ